MNRAEQRRRNRAIEKGTKFPAAIAWLYGDDVAGPFANSLVKLFMDDAAMKQPRFCTEGGGYLNISSGPGIVPNRNLIVRQFMENYPDAEWLVTVDADMCWDPGSVHKLLDEAEAHDYDVLGGLCFAAARNGLDMYPTMFVINGLYDNGLPMLVKVLDYPRDGIVTVDATGAAFMCIRRSLLHKMFNRNRYFPVTTDDEESHLAANPHPWYAELYTPDGGWYGEDISFCLRARQEDAKIGVHTGIRIGHVKPRVLGEVEWDIQQAGPRPYVDKNAV